MQSKLVSSVLAVAAALGSTEALAQFDTMSLNFGKVEFEYRNARPGGAPFAVEVLAGERGGVMLRPYAAHNLTFKRGQFYPADSLPQSWLGFDLEHARGGVVGDLSMVIDQSEADSGTGPGVGPGGGPHIRVFSGSAGVGASTHGGGAMFSFGDGSVRFVRDSVDVTLRGEPASLFNRPGAGEPLEARLPVPQPGQTLKLTLRVTDDRGAQTRIPIVIQRND